MRDPYARMRLLVTTAVFVAVMYIQPYWFVRSAIFYVGGGGGFYLLWKRYRSHRAAGPPTPTG